MAQITQIITIHDYNKMTDEQKAALSGDNQLAVVQQDWEEVRIQAAIAAMQSYISDGERMALVSKKFDYDDKIISKFIAEGAVMYADALIAELKKGG
jgi:hypothetical protein